MLYSCIFVALLLITSSFRDGDCRINSGSDKNGLLRLCLWTHCGTGNYSTSCPGYLQKRARRKCQLDNGEIGYYSKCCLYEEAFKETSAMIKKA